MNIIYKQYLNFFPDSVLLNFQHTTRNLNLFSFVYSVTYDPLVSVLLPEFVVSFAALQVVFSHDVLWQTLFLSLVARLWPVNKKYFLVY